MLKHDTDLQFPYYREFPNKWTGYIEFESNDVWAVVHKFALYFWQNECLVKKDLAVLKFSRDLNTLEYCIKKGYIQIRKFDEFTEVYLEIDWIREQFEALKIKKDNDSKKTKDGWKTRRKNEAKQRKNENSPEKVCSSNAEPMLKQSSSSAQAMLKQSSSNAKRERESENSLALARSLFSEKVEKLKSDDEEFPPLDKQFQEIRKKQDRERMSKIRKAKADKAAERKKSESENPKPKPAEKKPHLRLLPSMSMEDLKGFDLGAGIYMP